MNLGFIFSPLCLCGIKTNTISNNKSISMGYLEFFYSQSIIFYPFHQNMLSLQAQNRWKIVFALPKVTGAFRRQARPWVDSRPLAFAGGPLLHLWVWLCRILGYFPSPSLATSVTTQMNMESESFSQGTKWPKQRVVSFNLVEPALALPFDYVTSPIHSHVLTDVVAFISATLSIICYVSQVFIVPLIFFPPSRPPLFLALSEYFQT